MNEFRRSNYKASAQLARFRFRKQAWIRPEIPDWATRTSMVPVFTPEQALPQARIGVSQAADSPTAGCNRASTVSRASNTKHWPR